MRIARRRLLAVLAGGVVLAGGGITTLASWQDQTYDQAPLTLSRFNVEQTVNGSTWAEADTAGSAAQLVLSVVTPSAVLTPGGASTAWVGLRVDGGSIGGTVTMSGASIGTDVAGLASRLTYTAVSGVDAATCRTGVLPAASSSVTVLAGSGSALTSASSASFRLEPGTGGAVGATVGVCLKLSLQDQLPRTLSGQSVSPTWTFNATSEG